MAKPKAILALTARQQRNFWSHVATAGEDQCWPWQGSVGTIGYGVVRLARYGQYKPHRVAWYLIRGRIPSDLTIDHLCCNKLCCNVAHMETVTQSVNSRRAQVTLRNLRA